METKGFFQSEFIINVLVSFFGSFAYLWYGSTAIIKYLNSFSAGIVFIRQNLPSADVRFWCIKAFPALKGLQNNVSNSDYE